MNYVFKTLYDLDTETALKTGIPPSVVIATDEHPVGSSWLALTEPNLFKPATLTPSSGDYIRVPVFSYNANASSPEELTFTWITVGSLILKFATESKLKKPCAFIFIGETTKQDDGYKIWIGLAIRGYE